MIYKLKVFDKWDKSLWCTKIYYAYGISYVLTKYYMLHQAQSTAPGLDIMLLKQRFLSLSGQVANHAGENPPVDYMFSTYTWYVLYITCISWCWWYSLYINVLTWFCLLLDCWAIIPPHPFYIGERDDNYDVAESLFDPDSM